MKGAFIDGDSAETLHSSSVNAVPSSTRKEEEKEHEERVWDVVIVGAGLAGLSAARALCQAGRGGDFIIVEAQDRVGGRTLDEKTPTGWPVEMGGQWISPGHDEVLALARELQLPTFKVYDQGKSIYHKAGKNTLYDEIIPCGLFAKLDLYFGTKKLNRMAKNVPALEPWSSSKATKYDQQSIGSWTEANMHTREGKDLINVAVQAVYGETASLISLLDLLSSIASAGGDINAILDDAQSLRFVDGPQSLSRKMAEALRSGSIQYNQLVRSIQQEGDADEIHVTTDTRTFRCKKVICTMPRAVLSRVAFKPALPTKAQQLLQHQPMGSVIKINVVYSRPFWRERGLSGAVVCADKDSPIQITYDNSPASGEQGVIVTFMSGLDGRNHYDESADVRRRIVVQKLVEFFGSEAGFPIAYHDKVWAAEETALGAYGSYNPPGVLTAFQQDTQTSQAGNIFFAGDGISEAWQGYMEGAVNSGKRAAALVCESL
ncbi:hypothetical protein CBS101457_005051 [Exobasidium rhododendri]|nr:hypothetical protein CBS101457_005051 [Exobasidium rhododendri]